MVYCDTSSLSLSSMQPWCSGAPPVTSEIKGSNPHDTVTILKTLFGADTHLARVATMVGTSAGWVTTTVVDMTGSSIGAKYCLATRFTSDSVTREMCDNRSLKHNTIRVNQ